jgi:fibronectin type 3 domain-containing protein
LVRFTIFKDSTVMDNPDSLVIKQDFKPRPLAEWEAPAKQSDYAAVIAQALYGQDFDLRPMSDSLSVSDIINQSSDLQQRFAVSLFAAENDYPAALLAGWGWTDSSSRAGDQYVYTLILNRPKRQIGDTASVYIGYQNKRILPQPLDLTAVFGDSLARLSWDYTLLADIYHSYEVERKGPGDKDFRRISHTPVTLAGEGLKRAYYTDSLPANGVDYAYRIIGLTNFGEESPASDTVRGRGKAPILCPPPHILMGRFIAKDTAMLSWEYSCPADSLVAGLQIRRAETDGGHYQTVASPPKGTQSFSFPLPYADNYLKVRVLYTDSTWVESFPYALNQIDSVPPLPPTGLAVSIDSSGMARLRWTPNKEPDLMGYRVLRAFTDKEELSSITQGYVRQAAYTDSLSRRLGNKKVYYALVAVDRHYNESAHSAVVVATKPNDSSPAEPVLTAYERDGDKLTLHWITDTAAIGVRYALLRRGTEGADTLFRGNASQASYTDEPEKSGSYSYSVIATDPEGKRSVSPKPLHFDFHIEGKALKISGFHSYIDKAHTYIELSWNKQAQAARYRIYRAADKERPTLWKEVDASVNRLVDERLLHDTRYTYILLFVTLEGRSSLPASLSVDF